MLARRVSSAIRGVRALSTTAPKVPLFIDGEFVESKSDVWYDVHNPATNEVVARVPETLPEERAAATAAAARAFETWRDVAPQRRQRIMFDYQRLVAEHMDEVAELITREQGKTLADAQGDVFRGLEVVEHACSAATLTLGESLSNVATNTDTVTFREPLGVCAGIAPFNFPAMIPLWMFPLALTCGNTYVLKPSERVPSAAMRLVELTLEAGIPKGCVNVIHGAHDAVNFVCDAEEIQAISFVGGNPAGEHIHSRGTGNGKRVQSNMGAKNHAVVMPDADKEATISSLVGAGFGAAGQRCMALSMVLFVGETKEWIHEIAERAAKLKVSAGHEADADVGPLISPRAKERAVSLITQGVEQGAELLLDGRDVSVPGYEAGNFLGPTVLMNVNPGNPCYDEEIFAPVLNATAVASLEEAIALINSNQFGNGTAIFTRSGATARHFAREIEAGQVGVNLPIPVPLPMFSFTGSKKSIIGSSYFYGRDGAHFFTRTKTVISNWPLNDVEAGKGVAPLVMPQLGRH